MGWVACSRRKSQVKVPCGQALVKAVLRVRAAVFSLCPCGVERAGSALGSFDKGTHPTCEGATLMKQPMEVRVSHMDLELRKHGVIAQSKSHLAEE